MTECYECSRLAELVAENSQLRVKVDELTADVSQAVEDTAERVTNKGEMLYDSREKLEADAGELTADYASSGGVCDALYRGIIDLLDRQAAIDCKKFQTILEEIQECMRNGSR